MRGIHEESIEVLALRELRQAALVYAGRYLTGVTDERASEVLTDAARNYAAAVDAPKRRRR